MAARRLPEIRSLSRLPKRELVALATALTTRAQLADRAGLLFGNRRDFNKVFGYPPELAFERFRAEHRRDGLAKRIVRLPPQATWSGEVTVFESTDLGEETRFERDFRALAARTKMFRYFRRVDQVAGLGRYACLLIGGPGDLEAPLERATADQIRYFAVYSEGSARIVEFDWDEDSARYGRPLFYDVKLSDEMAALSGPRAKKNAQRVHGSRMIHVAWDLLEDDVYGSPALEAVFNRLMDMGKVVGSSAEALWMTANRGIAWMLDKDAQVSDELLAAMDSQLDEYEHDLRRNVKGKGIKPHILGSATPDPRGTFEVVASLISAATSIPQRILFGSERGQLASLEDRLNWGGVIEDRRENFAEPDILRATVDRLVELGALPKPEDGYDVAWPSAVTLSDDERASIALKVSQAIRNVADAGQVSGRVVVTIEEFRERWLKLDAELPETSADPQSNRKRLAKKIRRLRARSGGKPATATQQGAA